MDRANAIIVRIMFGAWIRKIRRTSLKGFGNIRQKIRHCFLLLHGFMFHNENLAGKRHFSPSSCCLQGIRFPCAESLPRLVQPPLSPLPGQAEPFHAVQAPAEQRLLHFRLRLPISQTRGHGSRISCVTPVGSQHEAVREAFPSRIGPLAHTVSIGVQQLQSDF